MQKRFFLIGMTLLLVPAMMWAQEMRHLTPEQSDKALRIRRKDSALQQPHFHCPVHRVCVPEAV